MGEVWAYEFTREKGGRWGVDEETARKVVMVSGRCRLLSAAVLNPEKLGYCLLWGQVGKGTKKEATESP